jgi:K+-transporting ATPase ATPase A chain
LPSASRFCSRRTLLDPVFLPIERLVLRVTGADPNEQQDWKRYSVSLLVSNVVMWLTTFAMVSIRNLLPLNPDGIGTWSRRCRSTRSRASRPTTNLQHYSGETGCPTSRRCS